MPWLYVHALGASRSLFRMRRAAQSLVGAMAVSMAASMAASLLLAGSAHADPGQRPWPAHWPIVLPPVQGPLPPLPPPGPAHPPATRAAARVTELLGRIRANLRDTRYQHHLSVNERQGSYRWDCSLMVAWVVERTAPRARRAMGSGRLRASHFARVIERAPTRGFRGGWQRIPRIRDVRPGDVFAWRRPQHFPSRNTGHVGFVLETPRPVPGLPNGWAVRVADSTSTGHQQDSRPYPGEGGFGTGTLVFLTDAEGRGTHYGWAGTRSSGYVVTPILFGRVGP
jgi:hypothetical protein